MEFLALVAAVWSGSAGFAHLPASAFSSRTEKEASVWTAVATSAQPFSEVVPSWNASWKGGAMKVELSAIREEGETGKFSLGTWTLAPSGRTSTKDKPNADGKVLTDTLVLNKPALAVRVTLTFTPDASGSSPELKDFFLSFTSPNWAAAETEPHKEAWGKELAVPTKAQHDYPKGNVLCSPTSVSMLMNYRAQLWNRPELAKDVPEVQASVFDPAWGGTGNWPFNTAYPGSFAGVRSFVTRLPSLTDAERFIASGVPMACSVDYKLLLNKEWEGDSGHLVVLIGFTQDGDPIINDPAKGKQVRQIYPRAQFIRAWAASKNTVYILSGQGDSWPSASGPWPSQP